MSVPDVTYLVNVYERPQKGDRASERLIRRELWYFKTAALDSLNVDRGTHGNPTVRSLPSGLPSNFDWSGKMFGMSFDLSLDTNNFYLIDANLGIDAVLDAKSVTLRIGLIDKAEKIPVDKCCRSHQGGAVADDPLPVGYAGYYANDPKTGQLPSWGILIPVFRPLINLPIIFHDVPPFSGGQETVVRCAYYISTADRPKRHTDNIKQLLAHQKRFVLTEGSDNPPALSVDEPAAQTDAHGDFVNVESTASVEDAMVNYIPQDDAAQWFGQLCKDAPEEGPPLEQDPNRKEVTEEDQPGS